MNISEIPVRPIDQTFRISLSGKNYGFRLKWNPIVNAWVLDIADGQDVPLLSGIPLVTGLNLLAPYPYLEFGGALYVLSDGDATAVPTQVTLGTQGHLYYITELGS